jgi:hypothetical protein
VLDATVVVVLIAVVVVLVALVVLAVVIGLVIHWIACMKVYVRFVELAAPLGGR